MGRGMPVESNRAVLPQITRTLESPLGTLRVTASAKGLTSIDWGQMEPAIFSSESTETNDADGQDMLLAVQHAEHGVRELGEYFGGTRQRFDVPLVLQGTAFQQAVWTSLLDIPFGITKTYRDVAFAIGNPQAVRAVGQANRRNRLPIIIPCHRVIGASGALVGYAGNDIDRKVTLLDLEGIRPSL